MHFFIQKKNHKIFFQDPNTTNAPKIEYDGVPYIIERRKVFDCQHGIDRNLADKKQITSKIWGTRNIYYHSYYYISNRAKGKLLLVVRARILLKKNHLQYAVVYKKLALYYKAYEGQ